MLLLKTFQNISNLKLCILYLVYIIQIFLVVTGHDGMIKRNVGYYDIYNYRNSKHFIETVKRS